MLSNLRKACMVVLLIAAAGCASAGKEFDHTHVQDIRKGVQTKDQIRQWFGAPYQTTSPLADNPAGCVERWTYVYARATHAGHKSTGKSLVVDFDKNGRVCDHAYSQSGN